MVFPKIKIADLENPYPPDIFQSVEGRAAHNAWRVLSEDLISERRSRAKWARALAEFCLAGGMVKEELLRQAEKDEK